MEYKNEREKAIFEEGFKEGQLQKKKEIAYRMHEKGYEIWYIAAILDESKQTIEKWIYAEDREAGMQLLAQVALMLLNEQRYEDLKRLGDEEFRNQAIKEYEKKKQEETGTQSRDKVMLQEKRGRGHIFDLPGREPDQGRNESKN